MSHTRAEIIYDVISEHKNRATCMLLTYPRIIHGELMTHRVFSRNAGSSRAQPANTVITEVMETPFIPSHWGAANPKMQCNESIPDELIPEAICIWTAARDHAAIYARALTSIGVHKSLSNRLIEPFSYITVLVTSTEWGNFFAQRFHPDAEHHMQELADLMLDKFAYSTPSLVTPGTWTLPFFREEDKSLELSDQIKVCTSRCARLSFNTQSKEYTHERDLDLYNRLKGSGHWSPFEHIITPQNGLYPSGNLNGFDQFRKTFAGENREYMLDRIVANYREHKESSQ